jgi:hypothetical protein
MLFNFFADRYVARASIAFAATVIALASVNVSAQGTDLETAASRGTDQSTRSSQDGVYRDLKTAVKARCRPLSNRWVAPNSVGAGNGRVTATAPAQPSAREKCIRQGLRNARVQSDPQLARETPLPAQTGMP